MVVAWLLWTTGEGDTRPWTSRSHWGIWFLFSLTTVSPSVEKPLRLASIPRHIHLPESPGLLPGSNHLSHCSACVSACGLGRSNFAIFERKSTNITITSSCPINLSMENQVSSYALRESQSCWVNWASLVSPALAATPVGLLASSAGALKLQWRDVQDAWLLQLEVRGFSAHVVEKMDGGTNNKGRV